MNLVEHAHSWHRMEDSDVDCELSDASECRHGNPSPAGINGQKLARKRVKQLIRQQKREKRREERQKAEAEAAAIQLSKGLNAFVEKTRQRVEAQRAAMAEEQEKQAEGTAKQHGYSNQKDIEAFAALSRQRVVERRRRREELKAEMAQKQKEMQRGFGKDASELQEFRSKIHDRIVEKINEKFKLPNIHDGLSCIGPPPCRKIAVVGAGPVGLWTAVCILRKYIRADNGESGCLMRPDAPEVVIFEMRPEEQHRSRVNIRIALSASTQKLMNRYTDPAHGHSKDTRFVSGMPLSEIETALLKELRRVCHSQQCLVFGRNFSHPKQVADEGFDCVLWAGGRRSLDDRVRAELECQSHVGEAEQVLVFSLHSVGGSGDSGETGSPGSMAEHKYVETLAATDLSLLAQRASGLQNLRIMLRPGLGGGVACWLWLLGLPDDVTPNPAQTTRKTDSGVCTLEDLLTDAVSPDSESFPALMSAMTALQQRLKPRGTLEVRWVEAAYWSADRVVCPVDPHQRCVPSAPAVLLGDAACGKPFYTGTTLNQHIWDVAGLVDGMEWIDNGKPMTVNDFQAYEKRYQERLRKNKAFQRTVEDVS